MKTATRSELLDTIVVATRAAGVIVRNAAPNVARLKWETKGAADFVSDVDRAAEREAARVLLSRFPDAAVIGEELSPDARSGSGLAFVIDPLDGTTNFLHGYPEYAVSIAATEDGELVAGAVLNVPADELFTAVAGGGAFRNQQRVRVSEISDPARALIGTGFPFRKPDKMSGYLKQFELVSKQASGVRRAGSAALDFADVACGRFDAFWELALSPWDVAAGILLVREAGGIVTDLRGEPAKPVHGGYVAGNRAMHTWLLRTLDDAAGDNFPL